MWESGSQGALSPAENGEPEGGDHVPRVQRVQAAVRTRKRPSSYMLATGALSAQGAISEGGGQRGRSR